MFTSSSTERPLHSPRRRAHDLPDPRRVRPVRIRREHPPRKLNGRRSLPLLHQRFDPQHVRFGLESSGSRAPCVGVQLAQHDIRLMSDEGVPCTLQNRELGGKRRRRRALVVLGCGRCYRFRRHSLVWGAHRRWRSLGIGCLTALAGGRAEVRPLDGPVIHTPPCIREALDVDELGSSSRRSVEGRPGPRRVRRGGREAPHARAANTQLFHGVSHRRECDRPLCR
jgi:hypothetical protein